MKMRSDVIHSLMPVFDLSKMFGLFPVKFALRQNGTFRGDLHSSGIIYGIALMTFAVAAQIWCLYRDLRDGWEKSSRFNSITSIVVSGCDVYATISPFIVAILFSPYRWTHIKQAVYKIVEVDEALKDIKTNKNLRKLSIVLILVSLIPTLIFSSADFVMWAIWIEPQDWGSFGMKGHINFVPLYFMKIMALVIVLEMAVLILNVGVRFDKINTALNNLIQVNTFNKYFRKDFAWGKPKNQKLTEKSADSRENLPRSNIPQLGRIVTEERNKVGDKNTPNKSLYDDPEKLIYQLTTLHSIMSDCVNDFNKAYGLTILAIALSHLLYLTITPYLLLIYSFEWYIVIDQVFWFLLYVYSLILLVQPCHSMAAKAKMTGELVSCALMQDWDPEVELQLETFSNLLLRKRVEITACGLFTIDRGLIASIVGTVTTYLVILLQSEDKNSK